MANTKISQLPSYTGTAADLRWFVMNNSGQTETFKYSGFSTSITFGSGTDSIKSVKSTASGTNSIAIGNGAAASGTGDISIGNGSVSGGNTIAIGNNFSSVANTAIAIGGSIFGNGTRMISIGNDTAVENSGIVVGFQSRATNGSSNTTIGNLNGQNRGGFGSIIGYNNKIGDSPNFNPGSYNNIIGSNNVINETSNIYGYNNIFGGTGNIITGNTSGTTLIGISNSTGPLLNDTVYLNNLQVLRTPSTRVQSVSSGTTFTCNLNNGAKSQFYITGTSTINITNVRDGASFMIKTQTDGNYVMTWTATGGYTFVFEGGIKDPGNNVTDIFVFEVFGSVIYGNRRHNYS